MVANGKSNYSFTLDGENISWLDEMIEQKRWRNRSHAIDSLIQKAREEGGEAVAENTQ